MKTEKSRDEIPGSSPPRPRKSRFSLRGRKKKEGLIQGKLRIRSLPGVFLVLGAIVVVVGTALAVAGYWPYRTHRSAPPPAPASEDDPQAAAGWGAGAKGLLSAAGLVHSERMKLLGPVIMGVGLFILICANTVLYENRDRETQMLLAQMRSVICSVSAAVPSADLTDMAAANSMARHYQWVNSLPAAHLNILCLQQLASSEPLLQTAALREEEEEEKRRRRRADCAYQQATLRTEALHHQESASTPSLHSSHSNSCNSSKTDFNTRAEEEEEAEPGGGGGGADPGPRRPAAPFKLNNCRLASTGSMSTLGGEDLEAPAPLPRRSFSLSCRTNPHGPHAAAALRPEDRRPGGEGQAGGRPRPARRESGSEVRVNMCGRGAAEPADLASSEEQRHLSWPRLDLGCARRYLKLENKEDSVDKLLDQLEQQCSRWDNSFGSGPFQ